jgi:hypothetical protein
MAGAQIDLGVWEEAYIEGEEQFEELVTEVISARFFETLETAPASLLGGDGELGFEYPFEG